MHSFLPLAAMGTNVCYRLAFLDISPCNQMMVQVHVEKEWTPQLPIAENEPEADLRHDSAAQSASTAPRPVLG